MVECESILAYADERPEDVLMSGSSIGDYAPDAVDPSGFVNPNQKETKLENVDLKKYENFVATVTSAQSNETKALNNQLEALENESGVNMHYY